MDKKKYALISSIIWAVVIVIFSVVSIAVYVDRIDFIIDEALAKESVYFPTEVFGSAAGIFISLISGIVSIISAIKKNRTLAIVSLILFVVSVSYFCGDSLYFKMSRIRYMTIRPV